MAYITTSASCVSCGQLEDQLHIFFSCPRAAQVCLQVPDLWAHQVFRDNTQKDRSTIITCILWNIWKARNQKAFDNVETPARGVLRGFINDLSLWLFRAKNPSCKAALRSWCDSFEHVIG
ncbi:hypothetical protein PVAP13_2NG532203 [Panicum virgatum]|uniref:Reverse transcriptase zinc-binding domain-containing protein n=1 Tax=Panicum virgatum TaxID=38727 RepID=A0A8T0W2D2_PANVG|nr:hypothetical protein PVAP13_2NG532203 [Panicum virgatum]